MDYRRFLKDELLKRQKKNRAYSLRAFARDLGMSSSRLSEILNSKVGLSETRASVLADRLQLNPEDKELFVDMVESEHARSSVLRAAATERVKARYIDVPILDEEEMNLMSDWHHMALLELIGLEKVDHTPEGYAKKLNLEIEAIHESFALLEKLGYVQKTPDRWIATDPVTTTTNNIPSSSIKHYHNQMLEKARSALYEQNVATRDFTSIVFAMNSEQVEHAKKRIRDFRRSLVQELESIPGKDRVFYLSMNMFSLTEDAQ